MHSMPYTRTMIAMHAKTTLQVGYAVWQLNEDAR